MKDRKISVVTPTLRRPQEVVELLDNLSQQTVLPYEVILVDGAPPEEKETEEAVREKAKELPFRVVYIRHGGGTAIQRNVGIDAATGDFIAFFDDDIRLMADFFERILEIFDQDINCQVGGITGYIINQHFEMHSHQRWRWYKRLRLLTTYEPGRYDYKTGYPINRYMQPPHDGVRMIDFMGAGCAVWRREVFENGLRFSSFFSDYGILEDAHLALRARRRWMLLECGQARCIHLRSTRARVDRRKIGYKCVVNYYYVFNDIAGPLSWQQKFRFWRFQVFELFRIAASALRRRRKDDVLELLGRLEGVMAVIRGLPFQKHS